MTETSTQTSAPATPVKVHIDPSWRPILEEICLLKDALDHAFRWHGQGGNETWINDALRPHGLDLNDFAEGTKEDGPNLPDSFLDLLLGKWVFHSTLTPKVQMMEVPPWAVLGWVRKDEYRKTPSLPMEELKLKAVEVNDSCGATSNADVWTGLPLYLAGEGKNRTQLHRLAEVDRLTRVSEHPFPDIEGFTASPVPFFPWAVAIQSNRHRLQVLPFRALTERLVLKLGMKWNPKPSWGALGALLLRCDSPLQFLRWALHDWRNRPGHALRLHRIAGNRAGRPGGTQLADAFLRKPRPPTP